jgi:WD40 repeat protein
LVTGAGDETLRFWNVFPAEKKSAKVMQAILPSEFDLR